MTRPSTCNREINESTQGNACIGLLLPELPPAFRLRLIHGRHLSEEREYSKANKATTGNQPRSRHRSCICRATQPHLTPVLQGFTITQGSEHLSTYTDTMTDSGQGLSRQFCSHCGSNMFNFTPLYDIVSVSAGVLDDFEDWKPSLEQYCIHRADYLSPAKGVEKRFHESINGEELKDDGEGEGESQT